MGLNALIVVAELVFGLAGGSVALISDAGHNLSDVLGLVAAFAAHRLGRRAPSAQFTYGLGGTSILAALFNAVLLLVVTGALSLEAIQRFFHPEPVATTLVMAVAAAAIVINGASAWLLAPGEGGDLNLRAAAAHLAADAAVAGGVVVGALVIALTGWRWVDPALGLAINAIIVAGTWRLLREALAMCLAGVPRDVEAGAVRDYLARLPGVAELHDLHIWPMSTSETALTVHLLMPDGHPGDAFLMGTCRTLRDGLRDRSRDDAGRDQRHDGLCAGPGDGGLKASARKVRSGFRKKPMRHNELRHRTGSKIRSDALELGRWRKHERSPQRGGEGRPAPSIRCRRRRARPCQSSRSGGNNVVTPATRCGMAPTIRAMLGISVATTSTRVSASPSIS